MHLNSRVIFEAKQTDWDGGQLHWLGVVRLADQYCPLVDRSGYFFCHRLVFYH